MKIYVASSWRNEIQDIIIMTIKHLGFEVYDFKNPAPGNNGFGWKQISKLPPPWPAQEYLKVIRHPIANQGFKFDMDALKWSDICLLVLPCGKSAHLELGYCVGAGKKSVVYMPSEYDPHEPELMYKMCDAIVTNIHDMIKVLKSFRGDKYFCSECGHAYTCRSCKQEGRKPEESKP